MLTQLQQALRVPRFWSLNSLPQFLKAHGQKVDFTSEAGNIQGEPETILC